MSTVHALRPTRTPGRPGPGPLPAALLRKVDLTVRRRIDGLLAGDHRSWATGDGTELAQVRPYTPGDDVRLIDWNVTARTGEPHVRVNVAERAVETWLLLDTSASMTFGTADRRKWDVAEGVSLAIGHFAVRRGNRLALATFGDRSPVASPARQGDRGLVALLQALRREPDLEPVGPTSLGAALTRIGRLARRRAVIVVVSDFRGPRDWRPRLLQLAARHDVVAVEIQDPREQELPDVGDLWLVDPESGRQLRVDTRSRKLRQRFGEEAAADRDALARELRSLGVPHSDPLDVGRLAPPARRLPPDRGEAAMSFGWPIALLGLVLVALALIAYIVVQHRRRRYVVRFTNFDLLENIVADSPRGGVTSRRRSRCSP